jgi:hypothetical protein
LFNGRDNMPQLVTTYTQTVGGERIWQHQSG